MRSTARCVVMLATALLVAAAPAARAITLVADPGPLGPLDASTDSQVFPIADPGALLGAPLDGRTVDVDVVFADMKHLKPVYSPSGNQYTVNLELLVDLAPPIPELGHHSGFLADENGLSLLAEDFPGVLRNPGAVPPFIPYIGWSLSFLAGADGLIHHGVHFEDLVFPTDLAISVTAARLRVSISDDLDPPSVLHVGEWSVPEPGAATLGLLALLILAARRAS